MRFDERLEGNEVKHHAGMVKLSFHGHGDLVVVAVQRLALAVGENQEMRGGEIEIIFRDFDAK